METEIPIDPRTYIKTVQEAERLFRSQVYILRQQIASLQKKSNQDEFAQLLAEKELQLEKMFEMKKLTAEENVKRIMSLEIPKKPYQRKRKELT